MMLARAIITITVMAISADAFSREKKLRDWKKQTNGEEGVRYLKRKGATLFAATATSATGSASIIPPGSASVPLPAPTPEASGSTIPSGSASVPVPIPAPTPVASGSTIASGSASVPVSVPAPTPVASGSVLRSASTIASGSASTPTPPNQVCRTIPIYFLKEQLMANFTSYENGASFDSVPYYNSETGDQLGFYTDEATTLEDDCVGTGVFSFGPAVSYEDQISITFTCNGAYNAITGGNGRFGCASGFEVFGADEEDRVTSTIYLCGVLCPFVGSGNSTSPRSEGV